MTIMKSLTISIALTIFGVNSAPANSYNQQQTGDFNVRVDLDDVQVIALLDSGFGDYGEYDYAYDYSDFTIKPIHSVTTKTPSTSSIKPWNTWPTIAPSSSTTPNNHENTAEVAPIAVPDTQSETRPDTLSEKLPETQSEKQPELPASNTTRPETQAENQPETQQEKQPESQTEKQPEETQQKEKSEKGTENSDAKINSSTSVAHEIASIDRRIDDKSKDSVSLGDNRGEENGNSKQDTDDASSTEEDKQTLVAEIGQLSTVATQVSKPCNPGYTRDSRGRCRRQNRRPLSSLPFGHKFSPKTHRNRQRVKTTST